MENINSLSPAALAFVGDAVYGLMVRKMLAEKNLPIKELHDLSLKYVSAPAQAAAYDRIKDALTGDESEIFRRGRNHHTSNVPKSATPAQYHTASGLECLFGYLYLSGREERLSELFRLITE